MKRIAALLLVALALPAQTSELPQQQGTVLISSGEFPPFTSETLPRGGFVNHLISEAFALQGYRAVFSYMPWQRALREARKGNVQASSYWQCTEAIQADFVCSESLKHEEYVFFYRKDKPIADWQSYADLRGLKVGVAAGYTYSKGFWQAVDEGLLQVESVQEDEQNIAKLLRGRLDALLLDPMVAYDLLERRFAPATSHLLAFHPRPVASITGHLVFSKQLAEAQTLQRAFDAGLAQMQQSGRYEQLNEALLKGHYSPGTIGDVLPQ